MASGAITPGAAASPVQPIVNTRKNVPMNSTAYRRMARPFVLSVGVVRPIGTVVPRAGGLHPADRGRDPTTGSNAKEGSTALKPLVSRQAFNTPAWQTSLISVKQGAPGPVKPAAWSAIHGGDWR